MNSKNDPVVIAKVEGEYQERLSSKTGRLYKCIVFKLSDTMEKLVFLSDAEQYIYENENDLRG